MWPACQVCSDQFSRRMSGQSSTDIRDVRCLQQAEKAMRRCSINIGVHYHRRRHDRVRKPEAEGNRKREPPAKESTNSYDQIAAEGDEHELSNPPAMQGPMRSRLEVQDFEVQFAAAPKCGSGEPTVVLFFLHEQQRSWELQSQLWHRSRIHPLWILISLTDNTLSDTVCVLGELEPVISNLFRWRGKFAEERLFFTCDLICGKPHIAFLDGV